MAARNLPALRLDENNLGPAMLALNPQQRLWVHGRVFGGLSQKDAADFAGYSNSSDDVLKNAGSRLAHIPAVQDAIVECSRLLLRAEGPQSIRELIRIRDNGEDDKVRLRASTELLDRMGGLSSMTQHTLDVVHHNMSNAEKDARILQLAAELGLDETSAQKLLIDPNAPKTKAKLNDYIEAEFTEVLPEDAPAKRKRGRPRKMKALEPQRTDIEEFAADQIDPDLADIL
jgi:hypothetical protein